MTPFEGYLAGMVAGVFGSLRDRRFLGLSFFYFLVIVSAHIVLVGPDNYPMPHLLGAWFYIGAGIGQLLILIAALALWTKPSIYIGLLAYLAVIINVFAYHNYPSQAGIHNYYYALINTIQVLQIVSLALLSPGAVNLYYLLTGRIKPTRKDGRWELYRTI